MCVARLSLRQHGAYGTAKVRVDQHGASSGLDAAAARLGALGPRGPRRHLAVDRALVRVAQLHLRQGRARRTAIAGLGGNGTGGGLTATVARRRARRPRRPRAHGAVDGTGLRVARLRLRQGRAARAAVGRGPRHPAGLRFEATATLLGAGRPRRPGAHLAVDRARLRVARLSLRQGRAHGTAVGGRHSHGARLGLQATATPVRADRPRRPRAHHTFDGAGLHVARLLLHQRRACHAAVGRLHRHLARLALLAAAARG